MSDKLRIRILEIEGDAEQLAGVLGHSVFEREAVPALPPGDDEEETVPEEPPEPELDRPKARRTGPGTCSRCGQSKRSNMHRYECPEGSMYRGGANDAPAS